MDDLYYIYLDSKIAGTARQIAAYFEQGVFSSANALVLIKKYKHKSAKQIATVLTQNRISFRFVTMADLDGLEKGVIFYPFNAQSNVRVVANRKLKHIFITHGESSKMASVKPIIRIYDYVITAGQVGIDRFLANGIFTHYDVKLGKFVKMGDTFVGKTGLGKDHKGTPCLFYAPTWEGGIAQEDYSSLSNIPIVINALKNLSKQYNINCIVIRPHPNTGHRLSDYRRMLLQLIKQLVNDGVKVVIYQKNFAASWREKWQLKYWKVQSINDLSCYYAVFALCDISAIETQLINEEIPYYLYWDQDKHPNAFIDSSIYKDTAFKQMQQGFICLSEDQKKDNKYKKYLIDDTFNVIQPSQRIAALSRKIQSGVIV